MNDFRLLKKSLRIDTKIPNFSNGQKPGAAQLKYLELIIGMVRRILETKMILDTGLLLFSACCAIAPLRPSQRQVI